MVNPKRRRRICKHGPHVLVTRIKLMTYMPGDRLMQRRHRHWTGQNLERQRGYTNSAKRLCTVAMSGVPNSMKIDVKKLPMVAETLRSNSAIFHACSIKDSTPGQAHENVGSRL